MPRFLVEYELRSLGVFDKTNELEFAHPRLPAKITLREKRIDLNEEYAILGAYVVLDAQSLEEISEVSEGILSEFVHALKLATSLDLQVYRKLKVIEWSEGLAERNCWFIEKFVGDDRPYKVLSQELMKTVELLTSEDIPPAVRRAIRWFSLAVSAKYMDEQFQCFWFSIEILAQFVKPSDKVPDICAKCRQPLYCEHCDEHPTHRPYPKQAIQFVFSKVVADRPDEAFNLCNEVRNRLMHGDSLEEIVGSTGVEFPRIVDNIGQVAWRALRSVIRITLKNLGRDARVEFLQTSTFCQIVGVVRANAVYTPTDPANPTIGEWP
jgi:hypothetical protein